MRELDKKLKRLNAQIEALTRATELGNEGRFDEAIPMAERVMYEEGLAVRGVKWPFILSRLYLKARLHDKCWKYLGFLATESLADLDKIKEVQVRILKAEGKHLDALDRKIRALVLKYSNIEFSPAAETLAKTLNPFINRAKLSDHRDEILSLVSWHLDAKSDEGSFIKDMRELVARIRGE